MIGIISLVSGLIASGLKVYSVVKAAKSTADTFVKPLSGLASPSTGGCTPCPTALKNAGARPREIAAAPVYPDVQDAHEMITDYKKLRSLTEVMILKLDDLENPKFWSNKGEECIRTGSTHGQAFAPYMQQTITPVRDFLEEYRV